METEGEMREERSGKRVFRAEKAWMQAGKRDGGKEENILTGLKCRQSGKQEKMPSLGKRHIFSTG